MVDSREQIDVPKFSSPQEEIAFLRAQIADKERITSVSAERPSRNEAAFEAVRAYRSFAPKDVLAETYRLKEHEIAEEVLAFDASHKAPIEELVELMREKGLKNALSVAESLKNPHVEDDFHRFVIGYVAEFGTVPGVREGTPLFKAVHMKLFQVTLLRALPEGGERTLVQLLSGMEQFYAGMLSIRDGEGGLTAGDHYFTLELAQENVGEDIIFYCAVPSSKERLFEKHLLAAFPGARIKAHSDDYNPFNTQGVTLTSHAALGASPLLPIRTFDAFEYDPLQAILNAFSKLKKEGEGAAIQFIISPVGDLHTSRFAHAIGALKQGVSLKDATASLATTVASGFGNALKGLIFGHGTAKLTDDHLREGQEYAHIASEKTAHPIVETNIRIIASAPSQGEAATILTELESAFNQFARPGSNSIVFKRVSGKAQAEIVRNYIFRLYNPDESTPLSIRELTTLFHFPVSAVSVSDVKQERNKQSSAPSEVSREGVILGTNTYRNEDREVRFAREDRMRHLYVIGQTGTGKTTLLKNMIVQDIMRGEGVCMIDPHGSDIDDILAQIPRSRAEDIIYFDPSDTVRPMAINMLEYDPRYPEQKTFVVNELFSIFQKLYAGSPESMGPIFEQYFRNATLLVIEDPETGSTLLDVSRVLADARFRELKLSQCKNPVVVQFWRKVAAEAGGEAALANIVPYITSKFDIFMANDIMRPIIAQEASSFNFRQVMDERKILLVNLSKGRLGDINANLIGLILVGKLLMASLSRVDIPAESRADFYLYIDEFQNITTTSISSILSEARKYRLSLTVAHQFIAQLTENIRDAVFGNVGSIAAFRVGSEDAAFLEKQFAPTFIAADIMNLENRNAYLKLLVGGQPRDPFNIATLPPLPGDRERAAEYKHLSSLRYGRPRADIEDEIAAKFRI